MKYKNIPVIGFCAWSGTGKTTLLKNIIPLLSQHGYQVGVVKHVHHKFDIDIPGKDSYEIRKAGASQVVAASRHRIATIRELGDKATTEPLLEDALGTLKTEYLDLILVEGYKHEKYQKIELHRSQMNRPLLHPNDDSIIALVCDQPTQELNIPTLDINEPVQVANFIIQTILKD